MNRSGFLNHVKIPLLGTTATTSFNTYIVQAWVAEYHASLTTANHVKDFLRVMKSLRVNNLPQGQD